MVSEMEKVTVLIVGAGPSGLATSACLNHLSIPNIILEREDCHASLWKKRAYDRLSLHLAKNFCSLPLMPHSNSTPTFMSKDTFVCYLDDYISKFDINPYYYRSVELAFFDEAEEKWRVEAKNALSGKTEVYVAEFLVVATGENSLGYVPQLPGLESFEGEVVHSSHYKTGHRFQGKDVLVVGSGNSGMEISFDLSNCGARSTSIVVRSPKHVLSREMVHLGMILSRFLPLCVVDSLITLLSILKYGDMSGFGIRRPEIGPFRRKFTAGVSPVIDVGTLSKIRTGEIKVVPEIVKINGSTIEFDNGVSKSFDAIVFATGYRSLANKWLKDYGFVLNEMGMPRSRIPNHWKGERGVYCVGLSRQGLFGVSADAKAVAQDIHSILTTRSITST